LSDLVAAWRALLDAAPTLPGDREALDVLVAESQSALEPFSAVLAAGFDPAAPGFRDAATSFLRLGRRAAELGLSPTAAGAVVPGLGQAAGASHVATAALAGAFLEGFVSAREEILRTGELGAAADASPVLVLGDVVVALPTGRLGEDGVRRFRERLEPILLRTNARAVVLDLGHVVDPDDDALREAFALDEAARMLGCRAIFVTSRRAPDSVECAPDLESALRLVAGRGLRIVARLLGRR
jgi:anti-anti-sigma regulatory factor